MIGDVDTRVEEEVEKEKEEEEEEEEREVEEEEGEEKRGGREKEQNLMVQTFLSVRPRMHYSVLGGTIG